MRRVAALALGLIACGRIGYEPRTDASLDGKPPPPIDGMPVCAADTVEIMAGSSVCIEIEQRGIDPWTVAKPACEALGRRLCTDAEWFTGCTHAPGLMNMTGDDYEWVAEEAGGIAQKRGASSCDDAASHVITDPYGYRCCDDK